MNTQLRDQWNAMLEAQDGGDYALLAVEMAKVLLQDAASRGVIESLPDKSGKLLLSEWSQTVRVLADYLDPLTQRLDTSYHVFKEEINMLIVRTRESARQLNEMRSGYESCRLKHEALSCRENELRAQQEALKMVQVHYHELAALNADIARKLAELGDQQSKWRELWPALAEACRHLQVQRDLLRIHFDADQRIGLALNKELLLLEQAPAAATSAAIIQIDELSKLLTQLDHALGQAQQEEQKQLDVIKTERL
jgi:hypothetical protein